MLNVSVCVLQRVHVDMGENAFSGVQRGKGMLQAHRTARARSAFDRLGQQANIPEVCNTVAVRTCNRHLCMFTQDYRFKSKRACLRT